MRFLFLIFVMFCWSGGLAQEVSTLSIKVVNERRSPLANASIELLKHDSSLVKILVSDSAGEATFFNLNLPSYLLRVRLRNYAPSFEFVNLNRGQWLVTLLPIDKAMEAIIVQSRRPFLELKPDRTVVNLDAGITNAGTSVMETLEKLPGVTIDKDGKISLRGRSGVVVFMDGKPTYLGDAELVALLNNTATSQVAQIELMPSPPAGFDAAGSAGIINLKMRKNTQRGFNGTLSLSGGQGFYPKTNNSLSLNYQSGKWNLFSNYSFNRNQTFTRAYALRTYFNSAGNATRLLDQASFRSGTASTHSIRTGVDYSLSKKTAVGVLVSATFLNPHTEGRGDAQWIAVNGVKDSLIRTTNKASDDRNHLTLNLNFRQQLSPTSELTANVDMLRYRFRGYQYIQNVSNTATPYTEAFQADIPTDINIYTARADYTRQGKLLKQSFGWKSSRSITDNASEYDYRLMNEWHADYGKSNRFTYDETIHAVYGQLESKWKQWTLQGGLRLEGTHYHAHQLGNVLVNDSVFWRRYKSLFPSLTASFELDSSNTFTLITGRRIDRPQFQKLNPFLFIINKYTYQRGNPYYRPQFTWNAEISHLYKGVLLTTLSYAITNDYFSQIFPAQNNGIILYTEGNLERMQNFGATVGLQLAPTDWWSFTFQTGFNHKKLQGMVVAPFVTSNNQVSVNWNNQVHFLKTWTGELNSFYNSSRREDIQEILDPNGQLSVGVSKSIHDNQGTIRLTVRDIFYTNWLRGNTQFIGAAETFRLSRDTRVATLSFTWRFGKAAKSARRIETSSEESQRVTSE